MGWCYDMYPSAKTAKQFAQEIFDGYNKETKYGEITLKPIKYSLRGRVVYVLFHAYDDKGNKVGNHIALNLISKDDGCWGEKPLDETAGVYTSPPPPKSWIEDTPAILNGWIFSSRQSWASHYKSNPKMSEILTLCKQHSRS